MRGKLFSYTKTRHSAKKGGKGKPTKGNVGTDLSGFILKKMTFTIPPIKKRKQRREEFKEVRTAFLKHLHDNCQEELLALGLSDRQIQNIGKGQSPNGFNVHHKLPLHGGGLNEFSNLILMPIGPHNRLHQAFIDPQIKNMQEGESREISIPWRDESVYNPAWARAAQNALTNARMLHGKNAR